MSQGKEEKAVLVLEDGKFYHGESYGAVGAAFGEIVFTTGMTGYQESLTDPSYAGQILVQTAPHIGNTGVNMADNESAKVWVAGYVIRDPSRSPSNWRAEEPLEDFLKHDGIVGIKSVDTRAITRHIRDRGAMRAGIFSGAEAAASEEELVQAVQRIPKMQGASFSDAVSTRAGYSVAPKDHGWEEEIRATMVVLDLGVKATIPYTFARHGVKVLVLPANSNFDAIIRVGPDGVFYSNGPGDPHAADQQVGVLKQILAAKIPFFGICFGSQLLGRALGFETYKLRYGHRGINQPVREKATGKVEITVHNHGFAVDAPIDTIVDSKNGFGRVEVSHICLNDDVVEGLSCLDIPAFSVQYHPEAAAGPHDGSHLFERFISLMERHRKGEPFSLQPFGAPGGDGAVESQSGTDEISVGESAVVNVTADKVSDEDGVSSDLASSLALFRDIGDPEVGLPGSDNVSRPSVPEDKETRGVVRKDSRRSPFIVPLFSRKTQVSSQGFQEVSTDDARVDDKAREERIEASALERWGASYNASDDSTDPKNQVISASDLKPVQLSYPGQWRKAEIAYTRSLASANDKSAYTGGEYAFVSDSDDFIESLKGNISEAPETIIINEGGGTDGGPFEEAVLANDVVSSPEVPESPSPHGGPAPVLPESDTAVQIQNMLNLIQREKEDTIEVEEAAKEPFPQPSYRSWDSRKNGNERQQDLGEIPAVPFSPPSQSYQKDADGGGIPRYPAQAPYSGPMGSSDNMPPAADAKERLQTEVGNFFDNIVSSASDGKRPRASRWFKYLRGSKKGERQ